MELQGALAITRNKLTVKQGDYVCLTKVSGINNTNITPGTVSVGELEEEIRIGGEVNLSSKHGISTSPIIGILRSFNSILIQTQNSVYLLEKV